MKKNTIFILAPEAKQPPKPIQSLIDDYRESIETLESEFNTPFTLFQDGKSEAYYIDCHISALTVKDKLDYEASLDPDEQDEIKANREFLPLHKLFLKMQDDAKNGRQFNDIIVEYIPNSHRPEKPLKIYGGQHRSLSIEESIKQGLNRYHGFRVYFALSVTQRNEIAHVSNANINVPLDLLDRMQETVIGPELRKWCKKIGLLSKDFAEKKNNEGIITARLARTFVVNYFLGASQNVIENRVYSSLIGNEVNDVYLNWDRAKRISNLNDSKLLEAGEQFTRLHKKQIDKVKKDAELSKTAEFRTKALTPSIISAWAYVAGILQTDRKRLEKVFKLPDKTKSTNPLSAKEMSEYKHQSDPKTYRGLGTRTDKKERGKLIQLFLLYSEKQENSLTPNLIDAAVSTFLTQSLAEEAKKKMAKVK
ncbi:MAG: hypothetical protein IPH11_01705 [Ignavibacteriales bacterium]|nr:hypothetical protein [Ignavibacteriales bacterium]